jgi:hypothetical protein
LTPIELLGENRGLARSWGNKEVTIDKSLPVTFFPIPAHRNYYHYTFLPGQLQANVPAPRANCLRILEADAVILDVKSPDWISLRKAKPLHPIQTAYQDPSPGAPFQIPPYLQQAFIEAYRRQADPRLALPSKGTRVNLTA